MEVPLIAKPIVKYNREYFEIWHNKSKKHIESPIKPYFYSYKPDLLSGDIEIKQIQAKALSNMKERTFYKYEFNLRSELVKSIEDGVTFEDNIPFVIRNRIDNPEIFRRYRNSEELTFLFLDIEQYCPPGEPFPSYEDRLLSIAWCTNDRIIKCAYLKEDNTTDKKLLNLFLNKYKEIDPDVIVVFNKSYDIPTIIRRCERNGLDIKRLSRDSSKPELDKHGNINIGGVIVYDVYDSVRDDQSLTGNVPNRGLKAVSDYFGFNSEREPLTNKEIQMYIGKKELTDYNKDDIRRTLHLFDIYWDNIEFNANDLGIPLNEALDLNISNLGLIVIGDAYREYNIIADGKNEDRFPEIFQRGKSQFESNYEGALVDIARTGLFEPVLKADYGSMYPTIMAEFNLSPDTTTLIGFEEYGKFDIIEEDNWFIYRIPDKELNKTMVIQVLKNVKGFSAELVKKFLKERSEYKKLWKTTNKKHYRVKSDNRKVKANGGVYGNQGFGKHPFGFVPIAIATTGLGRECATLLIDILDKLYPDSVIEWDTDGVYFSAKDVDKDKIQQLFINELEKRFKKKLELTIDIDDYDKGYFYKAKNYVLQKGDNIIYHGVAMKGRNKDLLKKNLIRDLAVSKLSGSPTQPIIDKYMELDFPLKFFAMNVTLRRHINQYKNPESTLSSRLALRAEKLLKKKPEIGSIYHYVKTNQDYELLELANVKDIDKEYYRNEIKTIADIFQVVLKEPKIDKWL